METKKYKNLFDNNLNKNLNKNTYELCGCDVCNMPINILRYVYYKCIEIN